MNWTVGNGSAPDLTGKHGSIFKWGTSAELKSATARGQPLIQPEIIGKKGLGKTANLVIDLTTGLTTSQGVKFPAMPLGGLDSNTKTYLTLTSPEIQTIINWIEGGCQG